MCRVQKGIASFERESVPNPLSSAQVTDLCSRLAAPGQRRPWLSLTGGEPLHQQEFLIDWLPAVRVVFRVYLETSGIHFRAVEAIRDFVDVVSMDFKLPSATGMRPFWDEHERFLRAVAGKDVFVKAVITRDTTRTDVELAAKVIETVEGGVPLILQPATGPHAPDVPLLLSFQEAALAILDDVRVIPQVHRMMNVP